MTVEQLRKCPVSLVVHTTRPDEDPVTTVPFILLMGADAGGKIILRQVPRTPAEGFCNWRMVQWFRRFGKGEAKLMPTPKDTEFKENAPKEESLKTFVLPTLPDRSGSIAQAENFDTTLHMAYAGLFAGGGDAEATSVKVQNYLFNADGTVSRSAD